MATYYSDIAAHPEAMYDTEGALLCAPFTLTISAAVASGDLFYLAPILRNSTLVDYRIECPDLDTDASATGTCQLGDLTDDARFVAATSQAIRNQCRFVSGGDDALASDTVGSIFGTLPRAYTAPNMLVLKLTGTVATARSSGSITGFITYVMQPKYRRPKR